MDAVHKIFDEKEDAWEDHDISFNEFKKDPIKNFFAQSLNVVGDPSLTKKVFIEWGVIAGKPIFFKTSKGEGRGAGVLDNSGHGESVSIN